jgi:NAD-dependent deacetylase
MLREATEFIRQVHSNGGYITVLTGAGISTDSGIPDFRSKGTGLWEKVDPMATLSKSVWLNKPKEFYEFFFELADMTKDKRPNEAHLALAELQQRGIIKTIITQNIDGLHEKAGSTNVINIHGNLTDAHCNFCDKPHTMDEITSAIAEGDYYIECGCGGRIRPSVVLFGDQLIDFDQAEHEAYRSDLMIVIGTSLSVYPAAYLPSMAKSYIIIYNDKTELDNKAVAVINADIRQTMNYIRTSL